MVITRKIEIFVCEDNKEIKKEYYNKLYSNRNIAVKVANMAISHLFALDNTMPYLNEEDRATISFLGVKGNKATRQNAPYVAASQAFKGKADMGMVSCILQNVEKMYQEDRKSGMWEKSLRSYKANMPIPFKADRFTDLRFEKYLNKEGKECEGCFFTLMGVPFQMRFGSDRSGNGIIVKKILEQRGFDESNGKDGANTHYKMCTSSIAFEKRLNHKTYAKEQKIFLYLCVDIPHKKVDVNPDNAVFCYLGLTHPIQCLIDAKCEDINSKDAKWLNIGTAEEFLNRRRQIQEAIHRCQINCQYNKGGKGRKRKMQSIEHFHKKEKNYVETKLHLYSRRLVDLAVNHGCGTIYLVSQKPRELRAKLDNEEGKALVLRNWSYYGLKQKIQYKCKLYGIAMKELGKNDDDKYNE